MFKSYIESLAFQPPRPATYEASDPRFSWVPLTSKPNSERIAMCFVRAPGLSVYVPKKKKNKDPSKRNNATYTATGREPRSSRPYCTATATQRTSDNYTTGLWSWRRPSRYFWLGHHVVPSMYVLPDKRVRLRLCRYARKFVTCLLLMRGKRKTMQGTGQVEKIQRAPRAQTTRASMLQCDGCKRRTGSP